MLYNHEADPHEMPNQFNSDQKRAASAHQRLAELAGQTRDPLESVIARREWPG